MKSPGSDEQNVIGFYVTVLGLYRSTFDDRQQVALYALSQHIGALAFTSDDFIDFVQEDDTR